GYGTDGQRTTGQGQCATSIGPVTWVAQGNRSEGTSSPCTSSIPTSPSARASSGPFRVASVSRAGPPMVPYDPPPPEPPTGESRVGRHRPNVPTHAGSGHPSPRLGPCEPSPGTDPTAARSGGSRAGPSRTGGSRVVPRPWPPRPSPSSSSPFAGRTSSSPPTGLVTGDRSARSGGPAERSRAERSRAERSGAEGSGPARTVRATGVPLSRPAPHTGGIRPARGGASAVEVSRTGGVPTARSAR